ncbi:hypothetical protein LEN26_017330 [Aphanomyces euteiches]|nr:hypothetical protein LEN26_017330 [Aphanomyces euteiches]
MSAKHENHTMACTRVLLGAGFINTAHFSTANEAVQVTGDVQTNLAQPDFNNHVLHDSHLVPMDQVALDDPTAVLASLCRPQSSPGDGGCLPPSPPS